MGLWITMDHSCHAKEVHASRCVKGYLPIVRCEGRDNWHIRVLRFWFIWPCILQGEFRTWDDGYWKVAWSITQGMRTHVLLDNYPEGNGNIKNDISTPHQSREWYRWSQGQCQWVYHRDKSLLQGIRRPNVWRIKSESWILVQVPRILPVLSGWVW